MLPLDKAELAAWLRLSATPGVSPASARRLLSTFGLPQQVFAAPRSAVAQVVGSRIAQALDAPPQRAAAGGLARTLEWLSCAGNQIVTLGDPAYPPALLALTDPPLLLYVKGRLELLHRSAVAIVGSRHATAQGLANTTVFARALAAHGLSVISGLALGVDGAAHRAALDEAGGTVAVIGTGADLVYPARHQSLAREIAARGAVVTEWPLGTPARAAHFPQRNRVIAALARGVLVIEAAAQSGSLITARLANEMGREVLAIPGSIHSPLAKGCHRLIKEGARLAETVDDVLQELRWAAPRIAGGAEAGAGSTSTADAALTPAARRVLDALGYDPATLGTLAERTGLESDALQATLLQLELAGRIAPLPGGRIERLGLT
jgi:DNA processing protein